MRAMETIRYEESGQVARIWLVRPLINTAMIRELSAVCDHLEDESPCKVVVFRGEGGDFCRGIDFAEFKPDAPMDIHGFNKWEKLCVRIERLPKATICALEGAVVGGGVQLALVADARVAAPDTRLSLNEVHLGFLPGMATFRLAKYVGLGRARRLIMRCQEVDARQAEDLGLVDDVADDIEAGVARVVEELGPAHTVTIELARRLLLESFANPFEEAIGNFLAAQHRAINHTPFLETVRKQRGGGGGA